MSESSGPADRRRIIHEGQFSIRGMTYLAAEVRTCGAIPRAEPGYRREKLNIYIDSNDNVNWQTVDIPVGRDWFPGCPTTQDGGAPVAGS